MTAPLKKSLGQHFLRTTAYQKKIIDACPTAYESLWEIGPGSGALTQHLVNDHRLVLFEMDRYWAAHWRDQGYQVIEGDILQASWPVPEHYPWVVVSNLPYNAGSLITVRLCELDRRPDTMVLMFQKEVADRILSPLPGGDAGRITLAVQNWYSVKRVCNVPPGAFQPPPSVQSTVIVCQRRKTPMIPQFSSALVQKYFAHPRKTIKHPCLPALLVGKRPAQLSWDDWRILHELEDLPS